MNSRIIPWKSLPKWVYEQRISDKEEDKPYWWREGSGEGESCEFYIKFRPLQEDPDIDEINHNEDGITEIYALTKHQMLAALKAYKKNFNRDYDYDAYFKEYIEPQWKKYEYDRDHNGGPSDFHGWKKWKNLQNKGKTKTKENNK